MFVTRHNLGDARRDDADAVLARVVALDDGDVGVRPAIAASRTRFFPDDRQVGMTSRGACSDWGAA
jgi:hypothetical protein